MDTMKQTSMARALHIAAREVGERRNANWPQHTVTGRFSCAAPNKSAEPMSSAEARMGAEHRWWLDQQMQSLTRKLTRDGIT